MSGSGATYAAPEVPAEGWAGGDKWDVPPCP